MFSSLKNILRYGNYEKIREIYDIMTERHYGPFIKDLNKEESNGNHSFL